MSTRPRGLASGGRRLWDSITAEHELDGPQVAQLEEACRAKDRLDRLDRFLRGDVDMWMSLVLRAEGEPYELKIDAALVQANATANTMKQLLAALRLPDEQTGKRPAYKGRRGAMEPQVPGGRKVSSLDRARSAKSS